MNSFPTLSEILNKGYVPKRDSFNIIPYNKTKTQLEEEYLELLIKQSNLQSEDKADVKNYLLGDGNFEVIPFLLLNGQPSVAAFLKLDDKFQDSTFVSESDKELIARIVGRRSGDKDIRLGDNIIFRGEQFRVIWETSGFYMYSDLRDEITYELNNSDGVIIRI